MGTGFGIKPMLNQRNRVAVVILSERTPLQNFSTSERRWRVIGKIRAGSMQRIHFDGRVYTSTADESRQREALARRPVEGNSFRDQGADSGAPIFLLQFADRHIFKFS